MVFLKDVCSDVKVGIVYHSVDIKRRAPLSLPEAWLNLMLKGGDGGTMDKPHTKKNPKTTQKKPPKTTQKTLETVRQ